jgi:hypothetical protein
MHPFSPKDFVQSLVNQLHATQGVEALVEKEKTEQDFVKFNGYENDTRCLIVLNNPSLKSGIKLRNASQITRKEAESLVQAHKLKLQAYLQEESQASELKQLSAD